MIETITTHKGDWEQIRTLSNYYKWLLQEKWDYVNKIGKEWLMPHDKTEVEIWLKRKNAEIRMVDGKIHQLMFGFGEMDGQRGCCLADEFRVVEDSINVKQFKRMEAQLASKEQLLEDARHKINQLTAYVEYGKIKRKYEKRGPKAIII